MIKRRPYGNSRFSTKYIFLNTRKCRACWKCIENCPNDVLGKIDFIMHRHARIKSHENCTGCLNCVNACKFDAIVPVRKLSGLTLFR